MPKKRPTRRRSATSISIEPVAEKVVHRTPLLLGHRGARRYAPENTIAAFDLALAHGCDGFEFDVRLTADDHAVICHDGRISRVDVARCKYDTLALLRQAVSSAALHSAHDGSATAVRMKATLPCLEDVLQRYHEHAYLYIELKVPGLERKTVDALRQFSPQCGYVVASFLPEVIEAVHKLDKSILLGLIADTRAGLERWEELPVATVMLHYSLATPDLIRAIHAARKQVMVWTVNTEARMKQLAELGVEGIISDDTQRLSRSFGRNAA